MDSSEHARLIANRITELSSIRGISINRMLSVAGLNKSVVDRMKTGNMPSADKLAAIAQVLDVPTEYLLGSGVFEKWDLLLRQKPAVLRAIVGMMGDLSKALPSGTDDLSFAKLVSIFKVDLEEGSDPAGTEILVISPIPTYDTPEPGGSEAARLEIEKEPVPEISENGREMLDLYERLSEREQLLLLGRLQEMVAPMLGEGKGAPQSSAGKAV
jgi:transcriptional regulator with XRE-family HTH domain